MGLGELIVKLALYIIFLKSAKQKKVDYVLNFLKGHNTACLCYHTWTEINKILVTGI